MDCPSPLCVRIVTQLRAHLSIYFCAVYNVIIDAVRERHCALIMICTEKSFAKALVSLWLAHISHRLHRAQWSSVDPAFDCRLSPHLLHTCQTEGLKRLNQNWLPNFVLKIIIFLFLFYCFYNVGKVKIFVKMFQRKV